MKHIVLGVDASNIRAGGGLTHLAQLLSAAKPQEFGISRVLVWGGRTTLEKLPEQKWLEKVYCRTLDRPLPFRMLWQQFRLSRLLKETGCTALFSPGGTLPVFAVLPSIVMSQNLLPFEEQEAARFGGFTNFMRVKMSLLKISQGRSMARADGVLFLTQYARDVVFSMLGNRPSAAGIVPHGIEKRFFFSPRPALPSFSFSGNRPFRILYVSIIDVYKHQWHVAVAVANLRKIGIPIEIDFVGPAYSSALKRLEGIIEDRDTDGDFLHYRGAITFEELHATYQAADTFIFASSCENLPIILLEAMASGLPIACSNKGPMPEVLGDAGIYFDPENVTEIETAISDLFNDYDLRSRLAKLSFEKAKAYSWQRCAHETFSFITETIQKRR